jgi:hypothetical protein
MIDKLGLIKISILFPELQVVLVPPAVENKRMAEEIDGLIKRLIFYNTTFTYLLDEAVGSGYIAMPASSLS